MFSEFPYNVCPRVTTRVQIQLCRGGTGGYTVPGSKIEMPTRGAQSVESYFVTITLRFIKSIVLMNRLLFIFYLLT